MKDARIEEREIETPAYVYNSSILRASCIRWSELCNELRIKQLYPLKTNSIDSVLEIVGEHVSGFAVSSVYEARLARELFHGREIHFTSPGLRDLDLPELVQLCTGIAFNSLPQWLRSKSFARGRVKCGLRVNPQLSIVADRRYDPCRLGSRLGVPLDELCELFAHSPRELEGIDHIHIHTNCDSHDWEPLLQTVELLSMRIPGILERCSTVNLGGGYMLGEFGCPEALTAAIQILKQKYGVSVVVEPGASVARTSFSLFARVTDIFTADGECIAVLDTSVNHIPEVFEYQYVPDVVGDSEAGKYPYLLAGSTCLAGDIFGEYAFEERLSIGSIVEFSDVGAYSHVKNHMFNGVPLPNIYELTPEGQCILKWRSTYEYFRHKYLTN